MKKNHRLRNRIIAWSVMVGLFLSSLSIWIWTTLKRIEVGFHSDKFLVIIGTLSWGLLWALIVALMITGLINWFKKNKR